jgi:hypothetical protein
MLISIIIRVEMIFIAKIFETIIMRYFRYIQKFQNWQCSVIMEHETGH